MDGDRRKRMADNKPQEPKIVRDIHVRNDQLEGTAYKKQNNVLRMVLFYATCGLLVILVSYGGLFFTKSNLKEGIANGDAASLEKAINFTRVNRTLKSQMPGILQEAKPSEEASKYLASADIKYEGPILQVSPENIADILVKSGLISKNPDGSLSYDNVETSLDSMAYSRITVKAVNKQHPELWLMLTIQKDESLVQWRVTGVLMSEPLRDKAIE